MGSRATATLFVAAFGGSARVGLPSGFVPCASIVTAAVNRTAAARNGVRRNIADLVHTLSMSAPSASPK